MVPVVPLICLAFVSGLLPGAEGNPSNPDEGHIGSSPRSATKDQFNTKCTVTDNVFNCSGQELDSLPAEIPSETASVDMGNNQLVSLTGTQVLGNLITLSLRNNKISSAEERFFQKRFPELKELDLSGNDMSGFPKGLPESLRKLDLGRNKLNRLHINGLETLEELYLNENLIAGKVCVCNVHKSGSDCNSVIPLKTLDLSKNSIQEMEAGGMSGLESLQVLSLADNKLQYLDKKTFTGTTSVTLLDLSRNEISKIENDTFTELKMLRFLYLRKNKLLVLPAELPLLEWFDASYNKITTVNETLKTALYPIEMVNLGHNPFHCDCHLLWLKEWYDRREYILDYTDDINPDEYLPMCVTPTDLYGEHWNMLADDVFKCDRKDRSGLGDDSKQKIRVPSMNEDLGLDPYSIMGENPKYIQAYDLHVQVRLVQPTMVTLEWRAPVHYTNLVIQYFLATAEIETTLFSQVQASQGHFILKNLDPESSYMICIMPKTETLSLSAPLDDCVQVRTPRNVDTQPRGFFEGMLSFHIDHTFESRFKLIFGCFIVSVVIVASGLLLAEGVLRICPLSGKEHDD